jgi:hypothetical protein
MKKQPGCERLPMRTPLEAVSVLVLPSPARGISGGSGEDAGGKSGP